MRHDDDHDHHHAGAGAGAGAEPAELLLQAARGLRRRWMEALAPWELSPHQGRALRVVSSRERGLRLADLAAALRIAPRSATEVVDALEAKGLVHRSPSPDDRRVVLVLPTPAGAEVRAAVERARAEAAEAYFAPLGADGRAALAGLLRPLTVDRADD